jgi:radical SAM protein with 4Fe4S-binding SPASM domain
MLNVTRLLTVADGDGGARPEASAAAPPPGAVPPPAVVVWNTTRQCPLRCRHCYAAASARPDPEELDTAAGRALVGDVARLGAASLVLSGGEPLLRRDLEALAGAAAAAGLHVALSTGGTLLEEPRARALRAAGVAYVGVSIDGIGPRHDRMRGVGGAFGLALRGLRAAREAGLAVGLRFTLTRTTLPDLERVLDLMEAERVHRGYVSHLVHVGRARRLSAEALAPGETRRAVETVFERAAAWRGRGLPGELVTGNNDADGPALYLWASRRGPAGAARIHRHLTARGGNASGVAIASVGARGEVHPDQFWTHASLGNVRARPLGAIWGDPGQALLVALRDRKRHLTGRCAGCSYLRLCGGGNRARAEALAGDLWAPDPGCHLTDAEIGIDDTGHHGRNGDAIHEGSARGGPDAPGRGECWTTAPAGG